jgi:protein-L-isoaspartate(D-aspartate) O-methyltransferase
MSQLPENISDLQGRELAGRMVEQQLRGWATRDPAVLAVMLAVPRHRFVPQLTLEEAYADKALPAGEGQTISQPFMVAIMTALLHLAPGQHVLEVGTGTGYQTAILAHLGAQVVTVERSAVLAETARRTLESLGLMAPIKIVAGDGSLGWAPGAPYDRILVTAGAPRIPAAYRAQLKDGGRLVIPVGGRDDQRLIVAELHGEQWSESRSVACRFVPLIGADGWAG